MNTSNDSTETTSDDERIERLLADNEALNKANEQLQAELALERQQLASAQQQLAALSQQLATLMSAGTDPMMPIGEHHFDVSKIAALTWDRSTPELPTVCLDGTAVWRPARSRPALNTAMEITDEMRVELPARQKAWEAECRAAKEQILAQINAAKEELKSRRRRREATAPLFRRTASCAIVPSGRSTWLISSSRMGGAFSLTSLRRPRASW